MVEDLNSAFDISEDLLDEIQHNIEHLISAFDVPEQNKLEVIKQINYMCSRTRIMSFTDELTGLPNRRNFDSAFEKEFHRAKRYKNKLTIAMFDVDHFKNINDTHGHQCGDVILKEISEMALQTFRKTDTVFRIGGEEFIVILAETDINQAIIPLERFRKSIETMNVEYKNTPVNVTVSIGVCELTDDIETQEQFIRKTDMVLYDAKNSGRNKTVCAE